MEKNNFILVSMNDPRAKEIAKILGNKTCHTILEYIEENPKQSESDISLSLKLPLNTVGYNIKQLLKAELIKKSENFFWSKKGKKIATYVVSNKSIIFSPKNTDFSSQIKSILPVSLIAGIGAVMIRLVHPSISLVSRESTSIQNVASLAKDSLISNAELAGSGLVSSNELISLGSPAWWFFGGFLLCIIIFIFVTSLMRLEKNYQIKELKGGKKK